MAALGLLRPCQAPEGWMFCSFVWTWWGFCILTPEGLAWPGMKSPMEWGFPISELMKLQGEKGRPPLS